MCGIIGYAGRALCKPLLLGGLERLEYRGYDSAGTVAGRRRRLEVVRAVGNLAELRAVAGSNGSPATTGIGHTRWATHGRPSERNAHPLTGCDERFSVVLNGIVENYVELKERLIADGHDFSSETDAEVVRAPARDALRRRPRRGRAQDVPRARRATSRSASSRRCTRRLIVGARLQCPLVVGLGEGETFVASDVVAFLPRPARGQAHRGRRARRRHARGRRSCSTSMAQTIEREPRRRRLGRGRRREGRLRDVHAQGDPRAARGDARDDRRAPARRRGRARHRPHRRGAAGRRPRRRSRPAAPPTTPAWSAAT